MGIRFKKHNDGLFSDQFKASCTDWVPVVACVRQKVSRSHNDMMLPDIEDMEVKNALFHMHPEKFTGPDGMSPEIYQNFLAYCWERYCERFFVTCYIDHQLQGTNIIFIPEKKI